MKNQFFFIRIAVSVVQVAQQASLPDRGAGRLSRLIGLLSVAEPFARPRSTAITEGNRGIRPRSSGTSPCGRSAGKSLLREVFILTFVRKEVNLTDLSLAYATVRPYLRSSNHKGILLSDARNGHL